MENGKKAAVPAAQSRVPDGMQRSGSAAAVGWFNQGKVGNVLSGKLTGMFERKDALRAAQGGTSNFFQVQVDRPCEVRAERGDEAKMIACKAGDFVNVNYGPKTKPWQDFMSDIKHGAEYQVYLEVMGAKVKISNSRTMHNLDAYHKMIVPPLEQADGVEEALEEPAGAGS